MGLVPRLNVNESLGLPQKLSYVKDNVKYEIVLRWNTTTDPRGLIISVAESDTIIGIKRVPAVTGMDVRDPVTGVLIFMMFAYSLPGYLGNIPVETENKFVIGIW